MARIRSIHYDALKSEKLASVSAEAERCYWRLSTHCDDDGRAEDDPRLFAAYLFPLNDDITGPRVDGWLAELHDTGLIVRYEADGKRLLAVTKWSEYQKPNRPTKSKLPPPPDHLSDPSVIPHVPLTPGVEWSGDGDGVGGTVPQAEPTNGQRAKPKRLIPDNWEPSDADLAWVARHYPQLDAWQIAREFRTYWQGVGKPMADWSATYRNRVQKVASWSSKPGPVRTFL